MPNLEGISPDLQAFGTLVFVIALALLSAWSMIFRKPTVRQETKEFALAGSLADMGPVKELVEQTGLLVQQQIRTAIAMEANAVAMTGIEHEVRDLVKEMRQERANRDLDEEVRRRVADEIRRRTEDEMPMRTPRKP